MKSSFSALFLASALIAVTGCKHDSKAAGPVFNTQVFVDFSTTRGEDPGPFYNHLKTALSDAKYPIRWPEEQSSIGVVLITVEDDNLAEVYQAFQDSLTATGSKDAKIIGIRVLPEHK